MVQPSPRADVNYARLFAQAVDHDIELVRNIRNDQWHNPTPCSEWDVRMLLNHLVNENRWVVELMGGKTVAQVGGSLDGDLLGDNPKEAYFSAVAASKAALLQPGALQRTVNLSRGDTPASIYASELFLDALIHGWDLAKGTGQNARMDPELVDICYAQVLSIKEELQGSGVFGTEVPVPPAADTQTKLLALLGRKASWEGHSPSPA